MPSDVALPLEVMPASGTRLGESPFWDRGECLWWVDITGRKLIRTNIETRVTEVWPTPEIPGFVVLAGPEQPFVGMERGIYSFSPASGLFERIVPFDGAGERFNDATIDEAGRLWASTLSIDNTSGRAAIHRVTADFHLATVANGFTTPNGLAADPVSGRIFFSDSHPSVQTIWTAPCDFTSGTLGDRAVFASMHHLRGRPDGAALAKDAGFYWIAGVDGGALYGFAMDGTLAQTIALPFPAPTKLALLSGRIAVTAKAEGGYGGELVIAHDVPRSLRGEPIPFWRPGAS